jgi:hypothetical protein
MTTLRTSRAVSEITDQELRRRLASVYRMLLSLTAGAETHLVGEHDAIPECIDLNDPDEYIGARGVDPTGGG